MATALHRRQTTQCLHLLWVCVSKSDREESSLTLGHKNRLLIDSEELSYFILILSLWRSRRKMLWVFFFFLSLTALCSVENFGCHSADFLADGL